MRQFLQPRWVIGHFLVLAICVGCLIAGFWQLDRLEERRVNNAVNEARYRDEPLPLDELLNAAGSDVDSLEYRRATATGEYEPADEVLIRSQVFQGQAGFDVVTPLVLADGRVVAVNRGWVPLDFDQVPVTGAPAPAGEVMVEGVIRVPPDDSNSTAGDGEQSYVLPRVDIGQMRRLSDRDLIPVYLEVVGGGDSTVLPIPNEVPDFSDEGPHLAYAIQWFSFALVGSVGYGFLLRRAVRRSDGDGEALHDFDVGESDQVRS